MLQIVALVWLALCWVAWSLAFIKPRKQAAGQKKVVRAPASKWGIILVMIGFALVWAYVRPVGFEKSAPSLIASMILGPPSVALCNGSQSLLASRAVFLTLIPASPGSIATPGAVRASHTRPGWPAPAQFMLPQPAVGLPM